MTHRVPISSIGSLGQNSDMCAGMPEPGNFYFWFPPDPKTCFSGTYLKKPPRSPLIFEMNATKAKTRSSDVGWGSTSWQLWKLNNDRVTQASNSVVFRMPNISLKNKKEGNACLFSPKISAANPASWKGYLVLSGWVVCLDGAEKICMPVLLPGLRFPLNVHGPWSLARSSEVRVQALC